MGTVGREGKRVGAIRLFEYLKTCQLAMLEMVRPPVRAIEIHDAIADQDRLCLALSRAQAVKVGYVLSGGSRMASPSSTAVSTGSAATALRMRAKAFE